MFTEITVQIFVVSKLNHKCLKNVLEKSQKSQGARSGEYGVVKSRDFFFDH